MILPESCKRMHNVAIFLQEYCMILHENGRLVTGVVAQAQLTKTEVVNRPDPLTSSVESPG